MIKELMDIALFSIPHKFYLQSMQIKNLSRSFIPIHSDDLFPLISTHPTISMIHSHSFRPIDLQQLIHACGKGRDSNTDDAENFHI